LADELFSGRCKGLIGVMHHQFAMSDDTEDGLSSFFSDSESTCGHGDPWLIMKAGILNLVELPEICCINEEIREINVNGVKLEFF
jgi:hypothetical protein